MLDWQLPLRNHSLHCLPIIIVEADSTRKPKLVFIFNGNEANEIFLIKLKKKS